MSPQVLIENVQEWFDEYTAVVVDGSRYDTDEIAVNRHGHIRTPGIGNGGRVDDDHVELIR